MALGHSWWFTTLLDAAAEIFGLLYGFLPGQRQASCRKIHHTVLAVAARKLWRFLVRLDRQAGCFTLEQAAAQLFGEPGGRTNQATDLVAARCALRPNAGRVDPMRRASSELKRDLLDPGGSCPPGSEQPALQMHGGQKLAQVP